MGCIKIKGSNNCVAIIGYWPLAGLSLIGDHSLLQAVNVYKLTHAQACRTGWLGLWDLLGYVALSLHDRQ